MSPLTSKVIQGQIFHEDNYTDMQYSIITTVYRLQRVNK